MATKRLSQITAATLAPALTDTLVGVTGGTTDNLFSFSKIRTTVDNPLLVNTTRNAPWDDFDVADGTSLTGLVSPSGHTWATTGAGAANLVVSKQGVINNGVVVGYGYLSDSQVITECEMVFSWQPDAAQVGANSGNCVLAFAGQNASDLLNYMIHLQFHAEGWNLLKTTTGPAGLATPSGSPVEVNSVPFVPGTWYGTNLRVDGTRYKLRMVYKGSGVLLLYMPDGTVLKYTDSDFDTIMAGCQTAFIEPDPDGIAGEAVFYANGFSIGPSKAGSVIEATANKDTAILRGLFAETGFTSGNGGYKQRLANPVQFTATTNGWYTIATESIDTASAKMAGIVRVRGRDSSGRKTYMEIVVGTEDGIPAPYHIFYVNGLLGQFGAGVVDFVRLSQDNPNNLIQLDISVNTTGTPSTASFQIDFEGYFTPVASPVVGATALGTWSQEAANTSYWSYQPMMGIAARVQDLPPVAQTPIGSRGFVTNSNQTMTAGVGAVVAAGGTDKVPVYCDGTNWRIG